MMFAAAALALFLSACGPQAGDTTFVISSDPGLRSRVAELLPELAGRARMELTHPIRAERRSREELVGYLRFKLDQELPPREARSLSRSYTLLGLMDDGLDLREILLSVYTEQVAGFYDPDSTALFVMDDLPVEALESVLVHELVHAVQDQTANLDSLTAKERGNDRRTAAQSAIEGHATLVMLDYMAEQLRGEPLDFTTLPDFSRSIRPALEGMRAQYPALASAPAIVQESLLFPYLEGASYVAALWLGDSARPAPFGPRLPQSTEQILDPAKASGADLDPPTELRVGVAAEWAVEYQNTLGQMEVEILLAEHLGEGGRELGRGWDGDRYLLLRGPEGEEALVWAAVWDSEELRDLFSRGLGTAVEGMGGNASLVGIEIDGRPGTLLRIGLPLETPVEVGEAPAR